MGNYTIVIQGHGINGNGTERDADVLAKAFLKALQDAGQNDVHGVFLYGINLIDTFQNVHPTTGHVNGYYPLG